MTDVEQQRITARIIVDPTTGCWLWNGRADRYGRIIFRGMPWQAHRLMMQFYRGEEIPWTAHVHHECERKGCVNPGHLRVLTAAQHSQRHHAGVGRRS